MWPDRELSPLSAAAATRASGGRPSGSWPGRKWPDREKRRHDPRPPSPPADRPQCVRAQGHGRRHGSLRLRRARSRPSQGRGAAGAALVRTRRPHGRPAADPGCAAARGRPVLAEGTAPRGAHAPDRECRDCGQRRRCDVRGGCGGTASAAPSGRRQQGPGTKPCPGAGAEAGNGDRRAAASVGRERGSGTKRPVVRSGSSRYPLDGTGPASDHRSGQHRPGTAAVWVIGTRAVTIAHLYLLWRRQRRRDLRRAAGSDRLSVTTRRPGQTTGGRQARRWAVPS